MRLLDTDPFQHPNNQGEVQGQELSNTNLNQESAKFESNFEMPRKVQRILDYAECSICLPYELSIIEIDRVLSAIKIASGAAEITVEVAKGSDRKKLNSPSPFDVWEFIFETVYELPTAECTLVHKRTNSTVYWDDDERFVVIAGSKAFCENAFPHAHDVLEHFYVQSTINEFEQEEALRECFAKLTSGLR